MLDAPRNDPFRITIIKAQFPAANLFLPIESREIAAKIKTMLREARRMGYVLKEVELILVDDAEQSGINREFLHTPGPTNIISFPDPPAETGALFLSIPTFARETYFYGQDSVAYFVRLLAHGLWHLCGLEHGEEMDALCEGMIEASRRESLESI